MKKASAFLLVIALLFTCSCGGKTKEAEVETVAETVLPSVETSYIILATSNFELMNNVFVYGHMPVDESDMIKVGRVKYYAVTKDAPYPTMADLENIVRATYVPEVADALLDGRFYTEQNGNLYCATGKIDGKGEKYDISSATVTDTFVAGDMHTFNVEVVKGDEKVTCSLTANGDYLLTACTDYVIKD